MLAADWRRRTGSGGPRAGPPRRPHVAVDGSKVLRHRPGAEARNPRVSGPSSRTGPETGTATTVSTMEVLRRRPSPGQVAAVDDARRPHRQRDLPRRAARPDADARLRGDARGAGAHVADPHARSRAPSGTASRTPPLLVPVLRAGLGMVDAAQAFVPESQIGFVGVARDEDSHEPTRTWCRCRTPSTGARCSSSTRCSRPAARWSTPSSCSPGAGRDRRHGRVRAGRARGHRAAARQRAPGAAGDGQRGRAAQRLGLHRPRPGRRRGPAVRGGVAPGQTGAGHSAGRQPATAARRARSNTSSGAGASAGCSPRRCSETSPCTIAHSANDTVAGSVPARSAPPAAARSTSRRRAGTSAPRPPTTARPRAACRRTSRRRSAGRPAPRRGRPGRARQVLHRVRPDAARRTAARPAGRTPRRAAPRAGPACRRTARRPPWSRCRPSAASVRRLSAARPRVDRAVPRTPAGAGAAPHHGPSAGARAAG